MKNLASLSGSELKELYKSVSAEYEVCKAKNLKLDITRGKPGKAQLDLSMELLSINPPEDNWAFDGTDARNYGQLDGLASCKKLFAEILDVDPSLVFVGGNSSLNLMYDTISKAYTHGLYSSKTPWSKFDKVKFLCPAPGYDRHFSISQTFGMEMITIPMDEHGPDMDMVEECVKDPSVKGMWCVPKYSNPSGIIYSDAVIKRIAALKPAAEDFTVIWDNAYVVHEIEGEYIPLPDILTACREAGNPHMVFEFTSTSKVTFPGAGVSCFACSQENMDYMKKLLFMQTISYDKINQLRHAMYLKDKANTIEHMKRHAAVLKPKFDIVTDYLDREIKPLGIAAWHRPAGGYFVSLDTPEGCAKRTHQLCKEAGVVLTAAGATYPYGKDPKDSNLRIAPSFPPNSELEAAMQVFCVCLKLAAIEKAMI